MEGERERQGMEAAGRGMDESLTVLLWASDSWFDVSGGMMGLWFVSSFLALGR